MMGLYNNKKRIKEEFDYSLALLKKHQSSNKQLGDINDQKIRYEDITFVSVSISSESPNYFLNIEFKNCQFNNCFFKNVIFNDCTFSNCAFLSCKFVHVGINNSRFLLRFKTSSEFDEPQSNGYSLGVGGYFERTDFTSVTFGNTFLGHSYFKDDTIRETVFVQSSLSDTCFYCCNFHRCIVEESDLRYAKFLESQEFQIDFQKYDKSQFSRYTIFHCSKCIVEKHRGLDKFITPIKYEKRYRTYMRLSEIYAKNGFADLSAEYYYYAKRNEGKSLKGIERILSILIDTLCGYGERPSHTFICIISSILLFGLFYLFSGFAIDERVINLAVVQATFHGSIGRVAFQNIIEVLKLYCHSVFFSVTTFSTVGYGNYVPLGAISSTLAAIQMLMGVSLTSLWTGCIFRKISR